MSRKHSSTLHILIQAASKLPWWLSVVLAIFIGGYLHSVATAELPIHTDARQFDTLLIRSAFRGFATLGQYLLPIVLLGGALASFLAKRRRHKAFKPVAMPRPEPRPQPVAPVVKKPAVPGIKTPKAPKAPPPEPARHSEAPSCPHCKKSMVMKVARTGRNAGGNFWGCSAYPKCRGIRGIF